MSSRRPAVAVAALLTICGLAACGGPTIPRTSGNVALCAALARTLDGTSSTQELAGLTFESNTPVTQRLREEVGTYVASAAHGESGPDSLGQQAAAKATGDCRSIHAPASNR
jgi:hypothetical protein